MSSDWLTDDYIDHCARLGFPTGIAQNAAGLKSLPVEVRRMAVQDGIQLIREDRHYVAAVAESIRLWLEAGATT